MVSSSIVIVCSGREMIRVKSYFKKLDNWMELVSYGEGGSIMTDLRFLQRWDEWARTSVTEMENLGTVAELQYLSKWRCLLRFHYMDWKYKRVARTGFINLREDCLGRVDKIKRKADPWLNSDHLEIE